METRDRSRGPEAITMQYDPRTEPHTLKHNPATALVVPRPIGWITTIGPTGIVNLAPYSFFNMVASNPPFVIFSSSTRKHSQANAETSGEFVFNMATYELRNEMNLTSGVMTTASASRNWRSSRWCRRGTSSRRGWHARRSRSNATTSRPSRWSARPASASTSSLILGEVINVYIDDERDRGRPDRRHPHPAARAARLHGLQRGGFGVQHDAPGRRAANPSSRCA